jgi:nitrogen fixation NifU-like protein
MNLYHEHVMDHYKEPRGRGTLPNATITFSDSNPLCGDTITLQLRIVDGVIVGARHEAKGCAVSQAGASMLFETLEGKRVDEVRALSNAVILSEFGEALSVSRVKCALLGLAAVKKALP